MCGIVGYIGQRPAADILLHGLESLSYRGYDSAGIAVREENGTVAVRKSSGKLERLKQLLKIKRAKQRRRNSFPNLRPSL